jgi:hypothetical protein
MGSNGYAITPSSWSGSKMKVLEFWVSATRAILLGGRTPLARECSTFFQGSNQCGHLRPPISHFPIPTELLRALEFLLA